MSLLDSMPHTASAYIRTRSTDVLGGAKDSYNTTVFADRSCWLQPAGGNEIREFQKQEIDVTGKIYFTSDPDLDSKHMIVVLDSDGSSLGFWLVKSKSKPDASAGLGVLFKVMVEEFPEGFLTLSMLTLLQLNSLSLSDLLVLEV